MEQSFINKSIDNPDERLVALVCSNMLKEPSYYQTNEEKVRNLLRTLKEVYESDPEFILQLAYYGRNHMNLRSTPNFLLAYASIRKKTKALMRYYFRRSTRLPTDVIEVVDLSQVLTKVNFADGSKKPADENLPEWKLTLSRELTDCIKYKFADFDEYQLGKYCSEGRRKRAMLKRKRQREKEQEKKGDINPNKPIPSSWTIEGNVLKFSAKNSENTEMTTQPGNTEPTQTNNLVSSSNNKASIVGLRGKSKIAVASRGGVSIGGTRGGTRGRVRKMNPRKALHRMRHQKAPERDLDKEIAKNSKVNMKRLIKICKIQNPQILVHKVLGKKYPTSEEEYLNMVNQDSKKYIKRLSQNSQTFDANKVGKRMKLEIPQTWEVEVSKKGNKKEVWEEIVENKNLGILATLRNLRNILTSSASAETLQSIVTQLSEADAIIKSKVLPFQFYSAYKEVQKLVDIDSDIRKNLSDALETAIRISTTNNLPKLPGKALIFADVSGSMTSRLSAHSQMSLKECAVLMSLMINFTCDECEFRAFSSPGTYKKSHILVPLNKNHILKNFEIVDDVSGQLGGGTIVPIDRLTEALDAKEFFDYIIIISDMMITGKDYSFTNFLKDYRQIVNPLMKYVAVNLSAYGFRLENDEDDALNIHISGFSDQILSMIAEADPQSQVKKIKEVCEEELKIKKDIKI